MLHMVRGAVVCTGVLSALVFAVEPSPAAAEQLAIRSLGLRDGLVHPRVNTFYRDHLGYIWLGTWEGLSRFDGERFVNYGPKDGLSDGSITDITEDRHGQLWVATHGGGVAVLIEQPQMRTLAGQGDTTSRPRFASFDVASSREGNVVDRVLVDGRNRLWCKTHAGIYRAALNHGGRPRFTQVWRGEAEDVLLDAAGRLWVRSGADMIVIDEDRVVEHRAVVPAYFKGAFEHTNKIRPDGAGGWYVLYENALIRMRVPASIDERHSWVPTPIEAPPAHSLRALAVDPNGPVWVGTTAGLIRWTPEHTDRYGTAHGLPDDYISALFVADDGVLWGGTDRDGAFRLLDEALVSYTRADGLPDANVQQVVEALDGRIYASTWAGGLVELTDAGVVRVPGSNQPPFNRTGPRLSRDGQGAWLIGTNACMYRITGPSLDLRRARLVPTADGKPVNVFSVPHEHDGSIWFSGFDDALHRIPQDAEVYRIGLDGQAPRSGVRAATLPLVRGFFTTRAGALWATPFVGVWRWHNGSFDRLRPSPGISDPHLNTRALHQDRAGRLWIGLRNHGLLMTTEPEAARPRFVSYSTETGLASNAVWCIAEDAAGRLYLGTSRGVDRLDPATGAIRHFTTASGLAGDVVNHCTTDREGRIWIGTSNGISRLDPRAADPEPKPPSVLVTRVAVAGREAPLPERGTRVAPGIEVPPGHDQVRIEYASIHRWPESPVKYEYWLEGVDDDWSQPTDLRAVQYGSLAAGLYTFRVRAIGSGGTSLEPAQLTLRVLPPIWQRSWFLLAVAGLALGSGWGAHRIRLQRALAMEGIRRQIAMDLHDEMGSGLSQVALLSELGKRAAPEESPSTFTETARLARSMREAMSDIVWAVDPRHDYLMHLIRRMRETTFNLLEAEGLDVTFRAPSDAEVNGTDLAPDRRRHLLLIFKESVTNIVRHARASAVRIELALLPATVVLRIDDDGRGFDAGEVTWGHGLGSIRSRAAALNATLTVDTAPGRGTRLCLVVPLRGGRPILDVWRRRLKPRKKVSPRRDNVPSARESPNPS
ncbi:MAG: hypothetical protein GEV06_05665 [Luteitalea sp.]|nr:hypothetical protein [Luteitalea sp.]